MTRINPYQDFYHSLNTRAELQILQALQRDEAIGIQDGLGTMGAAMADCTRRALIRVKGKELKETDVYKAAREIEVIDDKATKAGALNPWLRQKLHLMGPMTPVTNEDFPRCLFLLEALPENLDLKLKILKSEIAKGLPSNAIIGINTSSLRIDDIASALPNPERVIGIHFFVPADRNDLVEIIRGSQTSDETVAFACNYVLAMGKVPVIAWKDAPGGFVNPLLVGVIKEQGNVVAEGLASLDLVDQIFLETFYSKQIGVRLGKAQSAFKGAVKLGFFKDEAETYKRVLEIEQGIKKLNRNLKSEKRVLRVQQLLGEKERLLGEALGKLNQKVLYAEIANNFGDENKGAGSFFKPPESISIIQGNARTQFLQIRKYLDGIAAKEEQEGRKMSELFLEPVGIEPYKFPQPENVPDTVSDVVRRLIGDRLTGTFLGIAEQKVESGIVTPGDIDVAVTVGLKYNKGYTDMREELGEERTVALTTPLSSSLPPDKPTGIIRPGNFVNLNEYETAGIRTFVKGDIGHIVMARNHIQHLAMLQNSLDPPMIAAISNSVADFNDDPKVNSIIITSHSGVFCSGADLNYLDEVNWDTNVLHGFTKQGYDLMTQIEESEKPVVVVMRKATGGGVELALAADYRLGVESNKTTAYKGFPPFMKGEEVDELISFPECLLGLAPLWGGTERFPRLVGKVLALPVICNPVIRNIMELNPHRDFVWLGSKDARDIGFLDNRDPILPSDLPNFLADLVEGKVIGRINGKERFIDIREKPERVPQYDRPISEYPARLVQRLRMKALETEDGMTPIYTHKSRLPGFSRFGSRVAEKLIRNSDNPAYREAFAKDVDIAQKLTACAKRVRKYYIGSQLWFAQSKLAEYVPG